MKSCSPIHFSRSQTDTPEDAAETRTTVTASACRQTLTTCKMPHWITGYGGYANALEKHQFYCQCLTNFPPTEHLLPQLSYSFLLLVNSASVKAEAPSFHSWQSRGFLKLKDFYDDTEIMKTPEDL